MASAESMVQILNLRSSVQAGEGSSLAESVIQGLMQEIPVIPGTSVQDEAFTYAKQIPTSEYTS